jgi:predicted N-formylglutamate amidohydrolase
MNHPAFEIKRGQATGRFVIVCDHASNFVPDELNHLGLSPADLSRHIAYDIGAAAIAEILSERFDSPAIFCRTSRLVIDCNRQLDAQDLIAQVSDGTIIPGNNTISESERQARVENYFQPYHDAIEHVISGREGRIFLAVHSMTECMKGVLRPFPISLSSYEDRSLVDPLLKLLSSSNEFPVGDNQPYALDPKVDYSTPYHAIRRGLGHLQVEFRQDEIGTPAGQKLWAGRFGDALAKIGY